MCISFCLKLLSLCAFTFAVSNQATKDCAGKFQIKPYGGGFFYGEVEVVPIDRNFLKLEIIVTIPGSVRNAYDKDAITIKFSKTPAEAADDIFNNRPVRYEILFPGPIQPRVEEVLVNDQTICATPEFSSRSTGVKIRHTFTAKNKSASPPTNFRLTFQPDHLRSGDFVRPTIHQEVPKRFSVNFKPTGLDSDRSSQIDSRNSRDCGVPTITTQGRIFPWVVAIFQVNDMGLSYKCGGSLISNQHVLTAANCVMKNGRKSRLDEITVVLGKSNLRKWSSKDGSMMVEPNQIHIHPQFKTSHADIAMIKLGEIIESTNYIRPVCLWNSSAFEEITGKKGTLVGWGKDETGKLTNATPMQLTIPIVAQKTCHVKSNRTFCAGFQDGIGACSEDSGSGFVIKMNRRWMLKGVLSVRHTGGLSCDLSHYFIFMDVGKFMPWIDSFIMQ